MKSNIKEEIQTRIIKQQLLNDNSLLEAIRDPKNKDALEFRVRYVDSSSSGNVIREDVIGHASSLNAFSRSEDIIFWYSNNGTVLEFNSKAIAYFKKNKKDLVLSRLYILDEHKFITNNTQKIELYKESFSKDKVMPKIYNK